MGLVSELRRRNVFRMVVLYVVAAWLIMQVAEVLIGLAKLPDWIGPTTLILLAIGFPIALIFSWFYELTPEGISLEKDVEPGESITHVTGRRLDFLVIALMAAALIMFAYDKWWIAPPPELSIAVLPFENMSADPEQEYFTDGMHDELLTRLSRIAALRVISRTSVMPYRNTDKSLPEIAEALSVANVLAGGVQKIGNHIRINVQLVDARTDEHLWAETYDRELTAKNLFATQTDIAEKVAQSLQATLTSEEKTRVSTVPTDNLEAYQALLQGRLVLREGTGKSMHEAIKYYQQALELSPDFAEAYLAMADAYDVSIERRGIADSVGREKIEEYSLKALRLDESLGLAYHYLAGAKRFARQYKEAEILHRKALEYAPGNSRVLHGMGLTLRMQGRASESVPYYDRAIRLDPLSLIINESRGSLLRDLGLFEDAEKQYRNTLLIDPTYVNAHWGLGTLYWSMGQPRQAIEWFENAARLTPHGDVFRSWLGLMYLELGEDEQAQVVIDDAMRVVRVDDDNDAVLMNELLLMYRGRDVSGLPDGRQFMARYWYGSVIDLPVRALLEGDFERAIDEYEEVLPNLSNKQLEIDGTNYRAAIYMAFALKQLGEIQRATELLNQAEAFIREIERLGIHGYWVSDVQIQAIRENRAASFKMLRKAVDEGWRNLWRFHLLHDPTLETLRTESGFPELVSRIEQEMANQLSDH